MRTLDTTMDILMRDIRMITDTATPMTTAIVTVTVMTMATTTVTDTPILIYTPMAMQAILTRIHTPMNTITHNHGYTETTRYTPRLKLRQHPLMLTKTRTCTESICTWRLTQEVLWL